MKKAIKRLFRKLLCIGIKVIAKTFCGRKVGEICYNSIIKDYSLNPGGGAYTAYKKDVINEILKYDDPIINVVEDNLKLRMRLSHTNIMCYAQFPEYDRALPRIAKKIFDIDRTLSYIDVGANIGDTAALVAKSTPKLNILCIEGNPQVIDFLKFNTARIKNAHVVIEPCFCTDSLDNNNFSIDTHYGTSNLVKSTDKTLSNIDTLDNMVLRHEIFQKANLLKIDTDGFEITVLSGSRMILRDVKPVIHFEFNPTDYMKNNQDTMALIDMLVSNGYTKALFYTNFGTPLGVFSLKDQDKLEHLINEIDNRRIYYYDILTIPDAKLAVYASLFENELSHCV